MRPMRVGDLPQVAAMHAASWRTAYRGILSDAYLDGDIIADRERAWEARRGEVESGSRVALVVEGHERHGPSHRILGFAYVIPEADPVHGSCLDNLHVVDGARSLGLGTQLLLRAGLDLADRKPAHRGLYLWVYAANVRAQRFYERHGARSVGSRTHPAADGRNVAALRYAWHDVSDVVGLSSGSSSDTIVP